MRKDEKITVLKINSKQRHILTLHAVKRVKAEGEETLFVFRQTVNEAYIHEKHSFSILKHDVPSASLCVSSCSDYSSCEWVRAAAV